MIYPIYLIGCPELKQKAEDINNEYPKLDILIKDMFATMYETDGVGLAAPQIGLSARLLVFDLDCLKDDDASLAGVKRVMINAQLIEQSEATTIEEEGCLSIPKIREKVERPKSITLSYCDEHFVEHTELFEGFVARVIQHEYDHLEGVVFTDRISPQRKMLIKGKLMDIANGRVRCDYKYRVRK